MSSGRKEYEELSTREIAALFDRYGPMIYRRALRILGNPQDAEEAIQEVFIRAFKNAHKFRGESQTSTWLYRITVNYCLNHLRDANRRRVLWDEHVAPSESERNTTQASAEKLVLLRSVLAKADEQCGRAAVYVYMDGMSHAEAADVLGVSRRTVGNLIERFCANARAALEGDEV